MTHEQRIKYIEERAGKYCTPHGHKNPEHYAYVDGAKSMLPEIESLEKRVKELEEHNAKLIIAINYLPR